MKSQHHPSSGEARPFLFCMAMLVVAVCFSVIVCSSFYFALNYNHIHDGDAKTAKMEKMDSIKRMFTLAVK